MSTKLILGKKKKKNCLKWTPALRYSRMKLPFWEFILKVSPIIIFLFGDEQFKVFVSTQLHNEFEMSKNAIISKGDEIINRIG